MAMIFCRGCGKEIHDSAATCPHCGAAQTKLEPVTQQKSIPSQHSKWMAITSLILGVLAILATFGLLEEGGDMESILGVFLFLVISATFGIISLVQKRWGKGLSIAGVVLSALSLLLLL